MGPQLETLVASRDPVAGARALRGGQDAVAPQVPVVAPSGPVRLVEAELTRASDGRTLLRLTGTGPLDARPFELVDPPRLAIDLANTINGVARPQQAVRDSAVLGLRVAQNQPLPDPVTRIVLDLGERLPWEVIPGPSSVVIALGRPPQGARPAMASTDSPGPTGGVGAPSARDVDPWRPGAPASAVAAEGLAQPLVRYADDPGLSFADLGRPRTFAGAPAPVGRPLRETAEVGGSVGGGGRATAYETVRVGDEGPVYTGEPISIDVKGADLEDLFRLFAEVADLNIILDPTVRGKQITLRLDEVPWDQAMALVLKTQGLGQALEGNVLRVAPLTKLAQEEQQKKSLEDAKELAGRVTQVARPLSYATGNSALQIVTRSLSQRGSAVLDRRTNTLIIKDLESRMPELEALLDLLDQPTRQVQIEARIVETTKDFSKGWGFNWGFTYLADRAFGNQTGFSFPRSIASDFLVNLPISGANTTATLGFRNILNTFALDVAIQALEDRGRGRIISRPMVVVQNNEEAEIESGVQIPITTTTATEIDVTFVSASLKLTVTPQITADDNVIMDIEVENNQPVFLSSSADNASISTRQAKTVVRVGNGGTTVIGGIYQVNEGVSSSRTPFLSRIPLLGWLFRNKRIDRTNDELLIFLTPRIQEG
jgi:type IV pilus assembly protein PilQ